MVGARALRALLVGAVLSGPFLLSAPASAAGLSCRALDTESVDSGHSLVQVTLSVCTEHSARWLEVNGRLYDTDCDNRSVSASFHFNGANPVQDNWSGGCGTSTSVYHAWSYKDRGFIDVYTWVAFGGSARGTLRW